MNMTGVRTKVGEVLHPLTSWPSPPHHHHQGSGRRGVEGKGLGRGEGLALYSRFPSFLSFLRDMTRSLREGCLDKPWGESSLLLEPRDWWKVSSGRHYVCVSLNVCMYVMMCPAGMGRGKVGCQGGLSAWTYWSLLTHHAELSRPVARGGSRCVLQVYLACPCCFSFCLPGFPFSSSDCMYSP